MTIDRSARMLLAAFLLLAAVLIATNQAVAAAPLLEWWPVLVLGVLGVVAIAYRPRSAAAPMPASAAAELRAPHYREYLPSPTPAAVETHELTDFVPEEKPEIPTEPAPRPTPVSQPDEETRREAVEAEPTPAPPPDESETSVPMDDPEKIEEMERTTSPELPQDEAVPAAAAPAPSLAAEEEDDLTRIDGIGPKSAAALRAAGIDTFEKLAQSNTEQIMTILRTANVRIVSNYSSWVEQAGYAARADWDGLKRFNEERKSRGED